MSFARSVAVSVLLLLCFTVLAQAQTQSKPPQFIQVTTVTVEPSGVNDYEDYLKKQIAAREKTPGAQATTVYGVTLGGPGFTYMIVTPFEKWADRERFPNNLQMLTKVYGQAEANRLIKAQRDAIDDQDTEVYAYQVNSSTNPKVFDPPAPFVNLQWTEVRPEMNAAYQEYLQKQKIAQEKAKFPFTVIRRNNANGTGFTSTTGTFYTKLGDRDLQITPNNAEMFRQAFGEAEATRLLAIPNQSIRNRRTTFLTYRADLSRPRAATSN